MDCSLCGKEMRRGQAAYVPTGGLYFLPPGETLPLTITRRGIEDRGGIVLDMCSSLGWLRKPEALPAYICENCRKMIVEYGYGTLGL